jgi:hypothetical protein
MRVYRDRKIRKGPLEIRPYAGTPVHPALPRRKATVTMGQVGTIRRKDSERRILRDWTPESDADSSLPQGYRSGSAKCCSKPRIPT